MALIEANDFSEQFVFDIFSVKHPDYYEYQSFYEKQKNRVDDICPRQGNYFKKHVLFEPVQGIWEAINSL